MLQQLAKQAGEILLQYYGKVKGTAKADGSPVTIADKTANAFLVKELAKTGASVLSEEEGYLEQDPNVVYVVDPLDGTKGFISQHGGFTVMIGKVEHGEVTEGVVYAPLEDEMYYADETGAYRNGKLIRANDKVRKIGTVLSSSGMPHGMVYQFSINHAYRYSSMGLRIAKVADGTVDLYVPDNAKKGGLWDLVAASIIIEKAGGHMVGVDGQPLDFSICHDPGMAEAKPYSLFTNRNDELLRMALNYANN